MNELVASVVSFFIDRFANDFDPGESWFSVITGILSVASQYLIILFGSPDQAYRIWKYKNAANISLFYYMFILIAQVSYFCHGLSANNAYVYLPQILAFPFTLTVFCLSRKYGAQFRLPAIRFWKEERVKICCPHCGKDF